MLAVDPRRLNPQSRSREPGLYAPRAVCGPPISVGSAPGGASRHPMPRAPHDPAQPPSRAGGKAATVDPTDADAGDASRMSAIRELYKPSLATLTDLYELTMGAGYMASHLVDRRAVFTLSFR